MTYYGSKEMAAAFRTVRKNTLTIAEEIGEEHYGFRPAPDCRTVAQTLVHIAHVCELQEEVHGRLKLNALEGFDFMSFIGPRIADEQAPRSKAEVIALLRDGGERFGKWLDSLTDDFLGQSVKMPPGMSPEAKSRFEMILGVKEHEMHHRGQLMVVERMVGVVPHLTREMQARFAQMAAAAAPAKS